MRKKYQFLPLHLPSSIRAMLWTLCAVLASAGAAGADGQQFRAPSANLETCESGVRIPEGVYSSGDAEQERKFCSIDFYARGTALCPKMWSTSPATIVYDISGGRFPNNPSAFESQSCAQGGSARRDALGELAIYKMSMNAADTSGTYAPSSLLYYHLSRYFETVVNVPVSVYRTIDKHEHRRRVSEPGVRYTARGSSLKMLHAGWLHLRDAAQDPPPASGAGEILTADKRQLSGILILETGSRYGPVINGTRAGGWGTGQVMSFQRTAPFLALRSRRPLEEAIREGLNQAQRDPAMRKAIGGPVSAAQMVFWMREVSEIALLDFILGQQDRIGNIDFQSRWYWVKDGVLHDRTAAGSRVPSDLAALKPLNLRRTWLNDNDAGVRTSYTDFAERAHMLDGLAHISATTYRKLLRLDRDLRGKARIYQHLESNYNISEPELQLIVRRTAHAVELLRKACRDRSLRFDLEPAEFMLKGSVSQVVLDCETP